MKRKKKYPKLKTDECPRSILTLDRFRATLNIVTKGMEASSDVD